MLAKGSLRRIIIASLALVILAITLLFPSDEETTFKIPKTISYYSDSLQALYVIDPYGSVARANIPVVADTPKENILERIAMLTKESGKSEYLPNGFKPIIPKDTKVLDLNIQDGLLKIHFSKEFLNTTQSEEEKLIESIVYSLTEVKEVEKILIYVEDELITKLPKSGILLPTPLSRDFGINKDYDMKSIKDTSKITTYYVSKYEDTTYYTPVTKIANTSKEKVEVIIDELKSSSNTNENLMSYLNANAELLEYEITENAIHLSFSNALFDDLMKSEILEEVKYTIGLSIKDTYKIDTVVFSIGSFKETFENTKD